MARAIRNAIRANRFARIIRNWNLYFYSSSGRFARITRSSDSRESPDSRESCESIRANHATKSLPAHTPNFRGRSVWNPLCFIVFFFEGRAPPPPKLFFGANLHPWNLGVRAYRAQLRLIHFSIFQETALPEPKFSASLGLLGAGVALFLDYFLLLSAGLPFKVPVLSF